MNNCEPLIWYGAFVVLLTTGLIVIPFLRNKADLISAWNLLLLGIFIFLGLGCFEAALSPMRFHGLQWFEPSPNQVSWFMLANTVFLAALLISHRFDPLPGAVSKVLLSKWPPISTSVVFFVLACCGMVQIVSMVTPNIAFVSQVLVNLSQKAAVFAAVFSFTLSYRNRRRLLWWLLFAAVFLSACLYSTLIGGGRRVLLTVLIGPILCVYMQDLRRWRPLKTAMVVGAACIGLFVLTVMYSSIRHFDRVGGTKERSTSELLHNLANLTNTNWADRFLKDQLFFLSQQTIHYALLTQYYVDSGQLETQNLNTVKFVLSYPIPRSVWTNKPQTLGINIVSQAVRYEGYTSWGCGISGQVAYEGGIPVAILFGYIASFMVRLIDDSLLRQPTNPFLIALFAAASAHILAWPRGDLGIMTNEILECFLFAVLLGISARFVFGVDKTVQNVSFAATRATRAD